MGDEIKKNTKALCAWSKKQIENVKKKPPFVKTEEKLLDFPIPHFFLIRFVFCRQRKILAFEFKYPRTFFDCFRL